jgi:hypothetical protein
MASDAAVPVAAVLGSATAHGGFHRDDVYMPITPGTVTGCHHPLPIFMNSCHKTIPEPDLIQKITRKYG